MKEELIDFVCPKCGRRLCGVSPAAQVYCPSCGSWFRLKQKDARSSRRPAAARS